MSYSWEAQNQLNKTYEKGTAKTEQEAVRLAWRAVLGVGQISIVNADLTYHRYDCYLWPPTKGHESKPGTGSYKSKMTWQGEGLGPLVIVYPFG